MVFRKAILRHFTDITDEALRLLREDEDNAAITAKAELLEWLKEVQKIEERNKL